MTTEQSQNLSVEQIEELRLKAFKANDEDDIAAYFQATHKWFSDRHYRDSAVRTELEAFIKLADAVLDHADAHCRAFPIATAPRDEKIFVWNDMFHTWVGAVWNEGDEHPKLTSMLDMDIKFAQFWMPEPPPPTTPPLPAVFADLGAALEKIKGAS
jgi:hypothetical protein